MACVDRHGPSSLSPHADIMRVRGEKTFAKIFQGWDDDDTLIPDKYLRASDQEFLDDIHTPVGIEELRELRESGEDLLFGSS